MKPTHVLVAESDGEKLIGEQWITLEDFAKLFTYGENHTRNVRGELTSISHDIRVRARPSTEKESTDT